MRSPMRSFQLLPLLTAVWFTAPAVPASTTIHTENFLAYAANFGWINFRGDVANGARIGRFFSQGFLWSGNVGWIQLGSGTPANGWSYANTTATDWGVNHDGAGTLSGFAYSANLGWINFGHGQAGFEPKVDLLTGALSGYIWSANAGWIHLDPAQSFVQTDFLDDGPAGTFPGVPAAWEAMMQGALDGLTPEEVLLYYQWGEDPTTGTGARLTGILTLAEPTPAVQLTWSSAAGRLYTVETSDTLLDPQAWQPSSLENLPGLNGSMEATLPVEGADILFFRIVPKLTLSL